VFICVFVYSINVACIAKLFLNTSNNHPVLGIVRDESLFSNPVSALLNNDCSTKCQSSFSILESLIIVR